MLRPAPYHPSQHLCCRPWTSTFSPAPYIVPSSARVGLTALTHGPGIFASWLLSSRGWRDGVVFGKTCWRWDCNAGTCALWGKVLASLLSIKSSSSDPRPARRRKYQAASGLGWSWNGAHAAQLGLVLWYSVNSAFSGHRVGASWQGPGTWCPAPEQGPRWLCCFC